MFKKIKNKKGFSLVETMVAIFIFSILMTILSGSFVGFMSNFSQQKKEQKMVENAQYALGLMEKTIRTSVVKGDASNNVDFTGNKLRMFDNSQAMCLVYWYDTGNGKIVMFTKSGTSIADCGDFFTGYTSTDLTPSGIIEKVSVRGTVSQAGKPGLISVAFTVKEAGQTSSAVVGMSASLRDTEVTP